MIKGLLELATQKPSFSVLPFHVEIFNRVQDVLGQLLVFGKIPTFLAVIFVIQAPSKPLVHMKNVCMNARGMCEDGGREEWGERGEVGVGCQQTLTGLRRTVHRTWSTVSIGTHDRSI